MKQLAHSLIPEQRRSEWRDQINRATHSFDQFLLQVPQLLRQREERTRRQKEEIRQAKLALEHQMRTLSGLQNLTPMQFEKAVGSLYSALGWNVFVTPVSRDSGIDLVLTKEGTKVAVQCKRYKKAIGASLVREFYGSFVGRFNRGILVTCSTFSVAGEKWAANRKRLSLIDGRRLAQMMVESRPENIDNFNLWSG